MNAKIRSHIRQIPAYAVFGVAAWQSYWHTVEVAQIYGESDSAYIMGLSVDGLMIVAARYISGSRTKAGKIVSILSFSLGAVATLAVNLLAAEPNLISRAVAAWAAVAVILTSTMLHYGETKKAPARRRPAAKRAPAKVPAKAAQSAAKPRTHRAPAQGQTSPLTA